MLEYWSGVPFLPLGDLPEPAIKPVSLVPPALAADSLLLVPTAKPLFYSIYVIILN